MHRSSSRLRDAKEAAARLQESFHRLHEAHQLRKDFQRVLEQAGSLLRQIEQASATQQHGSEVVSQALDKLNQAHGCLATALRKGIDSNPSLLTTLSSLGGRGPVHSDSFKNAERLLAKATQELRSVCQDDAPEQTGLLTSYTLGAISGLSLVPGPEGTVGSLCVAVASGLTVKLDTYVGCREKQLKSHTLYAQGVKCMTYDAGSDTVWTGHADGSIKVHRARALLSGAVDPQAHTATDICCPGVPVSCLVVEAGESSQPCCWAGDVQGRVAVHKMAVTTSGQLMLLPRTTAAPGEGQVAPPKYLPVEAMLQLGAQMLVSGGYAKADTDTVYHRLQLWNCKQMKSVKEFGSKCGQVTCLRLLGDVPSLPLASLGGKQPSAAASPPQPQAAAAAAAAMDSATSWRSSISDGDLSAGSSYRLLSGHAAGQVVLWELCGRDSTAELRELAIIGEHSQGRVVKNIFTFPQWDMLVVATCSSGGILNNRGKLRVMHLPTPADLQAAASRRLVVPAVFHKDPQPTVQLQAHVQDAHTKAIAAATCWGNTIVTASTSTIRLWSPRQLAECAAKARPGLTFSRTGRASSGLGSDSSIAGAGDSSVYGSSTAPSTAGRPAGTCSSVSSYVTSNAAGRSAGSVSSYAPSSTLAPPSSVVSGRSSADSAAGGLGAGAAGSRRPSDPGSLREQRVGRQNSDRSPFERLQQAQPPQSPQQEQHTLAGLDAAARAAAAGAAALRSGQLPSAGVSHAAAGASTPPIEIPSGAPGAHPGAIQPGVSRSWGQELSGWSQALGHPSGGPASASAGSAPGVGVQGSEPGSRGFPSPSPRSSTPPASGSMPPIIPLAGAFGPFGAAAAAAAAAAGGSLGGLSSAGGPGMSGVLPSWSVQPSGSYLGYPPPMSPAAAGPYGSVRPPVSPAQSGAPHVPPWQNAAPTRPLTSQEWQQRQQQQQEQARLLQQQLLQEKQRRDERERQRLQQHQHRLGSLPSAARAELKDPAGSLGRGKAASGVQPTQSSSSSVFSQAGSKGADSAGSGSVSPLKPTVGLQPTQQQQPSSAAVKKGRGLKTQESFQAVQQVQQQEQQAAAEADLAKHLAPDALADAAAELAAHGGYQYVKQLPEQCMFQGSRALQVRCSRTNRLRTLLQVPCSKLRQMDSWGVGDLHQQLVAASNLHHPHMLQVQEVFVGPLHLHIVLEECSAGRLLNYPAKQAANWGPVAAAAAAASAPTAAAAASAATTGPGAVAAAPATLSPDFARWFFQQVVLAVDYYHTRLGNPTDGGQPHHSSKLSVKNTLLKVAPNLPQPVVKVPTAVLARGIEPFAVPAGPSSSSGSRSSEPDPFMPPEVNTDRSEDRAPHDTPAGDVWACGVLLLMLLGGALRPAVRSSASSARLESSDIFELPVQHQDSSSSSSAPAPGSQPSQGVDPDLRHLLASMLQPRVHHRITLHKLQRHPWFAKSLPPAAATMTQRFMAAGAKGRACKQSQEEIREAVLVAAAGPTAPGQLVRQLKQPQHGSASQQQPAKVLQEQRLSLLQGAVTPELQYGLQLQLHALRQACLQFYTTSMAGVLGSSGGGSSASRLSELAAAQQAAAYAVGAFTSMERANRRLQGLQRGVRAGPRLQLYVQEGQEKRALGMALLLQAACSHALFSATRLQKLLQGVKEPALWQQLQTGVPAKGKPSADASLDAVALERLQHLCRIQLYLLLHVQQALRSLRLCRIAAAAVTAACMGRRASAQGCRACPKPNLLTGVLGPSAAVLSPKRPFPLSEQQLAWLLGAQRLSVLLLTLANDAALDQQQQRQQAWLPVQYVSCLEELEGVQVSKQPLSGPGGSTSSSSLVTYKGSLPQRGGQGVLVVALSQLFAPGASQVSGRAGAAPSSALPAAKQAGRAGGGTAAAAGAGLPARRLEARVQRLHERFLKQAADSNKAIECPICCGIMTDPVNAADKFAYCRACIGRHISEMQARGKPVLSPQTREPMPNITLEYSRHLNSNVEHFRTQESRNLKLVQQQVQEQAAVQQQAWERATGAQEFSAPEHLGLAQAAQASSTDAMRSLQQLLVQLEHTKVLIGGDRGTGSGRSSTGSSGSSRHQQQQLTVLAPVYSVCADPPLLVLPQPAGGTLDQWISSRVSGVSGAAADFTATWGQGLPWPLLLQLLGNIAAALCILHQQQPAVVHGGVHAGAVHLLQQLPTDVAEQQQQQQQAAAGSRVCQLGLEGLLSQLPALSSCHPFLAAPEVLLATGPASPAADVYGFGVLMFQLATGWLPQQYTPGTDEQLSAVLWCRDMMAQAGSTSPLAAVQALARLGSQAGAPALQTGEWTPYGCHLPSEAALQALPAGYVGLMEQCLQRVAPARPCMQEVAARLVDAAAGGKQASGVSVMLDAVRAVQQRRAAGGLQQLPLSAVAGSHVPSRVSPTKC